MERAILHSDLNAFFASVEIMLNPSLRGKAVAVCGSTEDRRGIVLAKSELAKAAGIKTGMVNWEAKRLCPELILLPPRFDQYLKYSKLTREIYARFTDLVEPFGVDECWLDVTGSQSLYGNGEEIAQRIRKTVREELGLTVSVGVSFNKIFAKLGSDMKKPDAVTVISRGDVRKKIWTLPVWDLMYVGRATKKQLLSFNIKTIGELAAVDPELLKRHFGKCGTILWLCANGMENSNVMDTEFKPIIKSIGHGTTCTEDLTTAEEAWKVLLELSQDIGHKLRANELSACGVQIAVRDAGLAWKQYQAQLDAPSMSAYELAAKARSLFENNYTWSVPVRSLTVRAINLISNNLPRQLELFGDYDRQKRREKLDKAVDGIRSVYGSGSVIPAVLLGGHKMPGNGENDARMPSVMYQIQ